MDFIRVQEGCFILKFDDKVVKDLVGSHLSLLPFYKNDRDLLFILEVVPTNETVGGVKNVNKLSAISTLVKKEDDPYQVISKLLRNYQIDVNISQIKDKAIVSLCVDTIRERKERAIVEINRYYNVLFSINNKLLSKVINNQIKPDSRLVVLSIDDLEILIKYFGRYIEDVPDDAKELLKFLEDRKIKIISSNLYYNILNILEHKENI